MKIIIEGIANGGGVEVKASETYDLIENNVVELTNSPYPICKYDELSFVKDELFIGKYKFKLSNKDIVFEDSDIAYGYGNTPTNEHRRIEIKVVE